MTDEKMTLTFPKKNCEDITIKGLPFVKVDTGMTAEELIRALLSWSGAEDKAVVVKKASE